LFPLVGGGSTPASPSALFYGLSLFDDEFVILNSITSPKVDDRDNNDVDDEKSSIITDTEHSSQSTPRLRQNSSPTTMNSFKNTLRMGIASRIE
jgi:hypothetical protein